MWIVISVILVVVVSISFLLILQTQIVLKSEQQLYCLRVPLFLSLRIVPDEQIFKLKGKAFFIPFSVGVDDFYKEEKDQHWTVRNSIKLGKIKFHFRRNFKVVKEVYRAITVHHFYATFDTGDYPLNAKLIPIASVLQKQNVAVQVNFVNYNMIDAHIYTRLYKILWIVLKHLRTKN